MDGFQRAFQVEEFLLFQVSAFQSDAGHAFADIEEVAEGKLVGIFLNASELPYLLQPFVDDLCIFAHGNLVHLFFAKWTEAPFAEHRPHFEEPYLLFKRFGIYHFLMPDIRQAAVLSPFCRGADR